MKMKNACSLTALLVCAVFSSVCLADNAYSPPPWQLGGHLQTIVPYLFPQVAAQSYYRERWELEDGDFVDADWTQAPEQVAANTPVLLLLHGLEGNSQSHYARILMAEVKRRGWLGVVVHFRGCSGEANRLPRVYYAGDAEEINRYIARLHELLPAHPLYVAGVSLGGNALLKWLGQYSQHAQQRINAAAAISAPIDLQATAHSLDEGLNYWLYSKNFVATMKPKALQMAARFPGRLNPQSIQSASTVQDMDNAVTAVLFGADDADDYYAQNAAKPWLPSISTPTLILNAQNDPFVPFASLPTQAEVSAAVTLDYQAAGGHAGFYGTGTDGQRPWLAQHVFDFFDSSTSQALEQFFAPYIAAHQFSPSATPMP